MQYGGIGTADDLFRVIAIEPLSAFIPEQDVTFQVAANDGELGGKLQHVFDEVERLFGGGYHPSVKEVRFQGKFVTRYGTRGQSDSLREAQQKTYRKGASAQENTSGKRYQNGIDEL